MKSPISSFSIRKYYISAIIDSLVIIFFTIQPAIFITLNILAHGQNIEFGKYYLGGELFLYSISFLSSSYLIYNHFKVRLSSWKDNLNKLILILLSILSALYSTTSSTSKLDSRFMKWTSVIAIGISLIVFYHAQVISNMHSPDVAEERRDEQKIIEEALN